MMKSMLSLVAVCCVLAIVGCHNNKTSGSKASPGAMPECKCAAGCMHDGKCNTGCTADCCKKKANMGAVSDKKSDCCGGSGSCTEKKDTTSMGAVGEKKSGCCSGDAAKSGASLGAVADQKPGCCSGAAHSNN